MPGHGIPGRATLAKLLVKAFLQWLGVVGKNKDVREQLGSWAVSTPNASSPLVQVKSSSYNGEYGGVTGRRFSHSGNQMEGPITAIRIRADTHYIIG